MRRIGLGMIWVIGIFLVIRAIAEPFAIDLSDPRSYRTDWGGPSLFGVLAVHVIPGVLAAVWMTMRLRHRRPRSD
jgi:hypothetical protein